MKYDTEGFNFSQKILPNDLRVQVINTVLDFVYQVQHSTDSRRFIAIFERSDISKRFSWCFNTSRFKAVALFDAGGNTE